MVDKGRSISAVGPQHVVHTSLPSAEWGESAREEGMNGERTATRRSWSSTNLAASLPLESPDNKGLYEKMKRLGIE